MTAFELKLARAMAEDDTIDVSKANMDVLIGFGCPDFAPVKVLPGWFSDESGELKSLG